MRLQQVLLSLFITCMLPLVLTAQETEATFTTRDVNIVLDDAGYEAAATLTVPDGDGPFATMILIHGSGPYDMDATYVLPTGEVVSANFERIAEELAAQGIATLRYNKRGVLADRSFDFAQMQAATFERLIADAEAVLTFAQSQPEVDTAALYLFGWSEGAWVASHVTNNQPDAIAGVLLMGPPNQALTVILEYQYFDLVVPYATNTLDVDASGALTIEEIQALPSGPGLLVAWYDFNSDPANPSLNPMVDTNSDGEIDIEAELRPGLEQALTFMGSFFDDGLSRVTSDLLSDTETPVLILHGTNDGYVPLVEGQMIADALGEQAQLNIYEDLGHALSETANPAIDNFEPIAQVVLDDMAAWLNEQ